MVYAKFNDDSSNLVQQCHTYNHLVYESNSRITKLATASPLPIYYQSIDQ